MKLVMIESFDCREGVNFFYNTTLNKHCDSTLFQVECSPSNFTFIEGVAPFTLTSLFVIKTKR